MDYTIGDAFLSEVMGTGMLILLGAGVVANVVLPRNKGFDGGWLLINFGWGLAVFAGVYTAYKSGAHLNPAVTMGIWTSGADEFAPGIDVTVQNGFLYVVAQMAGAALGAAFAFLAYKKHFDEDADPATKLAVFSTGPAIRSYAWNFITEVIATFVLVFVILAFAQTPAELGALPVALLVVGIGASLGGPTGYAINPARDLGPRIAHALLPIRGKGSSDWAYSWVPFLGPLVGGAIGGLVASVYIV
ncbi:aquaporin family protein [Cellulomonas sp. zg-ZUI188]|uniref:Aquaporin family protein n=2 Tax=Cellulomonas fengjieae TaxID=2819978 RepID=A0ABS3SHJ8_9CELL|nr:aquaporin family protein [Cellulomonas fengjieae]MBO3100873.1 aquaporin family protein [Cellulomonas fengjieae]QVI66295.1 aquaporin family protein [Cellulomonas fengjieae]